MRTRAADVRLLLVEIAVPLILFCAIDYALSRYRAVAAAPGSEPAFPLFEPATAPDGVAVLRRSDASLTFRRDKPPNGFRVFVIGESSVFGLPFGPDLAFPQFLQERLQAAMPTRTVEVVNAGMAGIASWHARTLIEEIADYRPDAIIVYLGENELIRAAPARGGALRWLATQLRLRQLAAVAERTWYRWVHRAAVPRPRAEPLVFGSLRDRARGEATLAPRHREQKIDRFRGNLRAIVETGRATGAVVILAGLAQNLRDYPPGSSRHRCGLSDEAVDTWRAAVREADAKMARQDYAGALEDLEVAARIDQEPAILHYLRGRCLDTLGRIDGAREEYQHASDLDAVPMGPPTALNDVIREVAHEDGAKFVDVQAALERCSPHGLVGETLFFDSVHPTVGGHAAIAGIFAQALGASDGECQVTEVSALNAAHPEVEEKILQTNVLTYLILGWYDRAAAELAKAADRYPNLLKLRDGIDASRKHNPVKSWDDFPAACD